MSSFSLDLKQAFEADIAIAQKAHGDNASGGMMTLLASVRDILGA